MAGGRITKKAEAQNFSPSKTSWESVKYSYKLYEIAFYQNIFRSFAFIRLLVAMDRVPKSEDITKIQKRFYLIKTTVMDELIAAVVPGICTQTFFPVAKAVSKVASPSFSIDWSR